MIKIQITLKTGEKKAIKGKTWKITQYLHQIRDQILFFDVITNNNLTYELI